MPDDDARSVEPRSSPDAGRRLRDVSSELLRRIDHLRDLERQSREVPMGSPEFVSISTEIEAQAREVFTLAWEQKTVAHDVEPQEESIEELDAGAGRGSSGRG